MAHKDLVMWCLDKDSLATDLLHVLVGNIGQEFGPEPRSIHENLVAEAF
jgi:hypothetical protein